MEQNNLLRIQPETIENVYDLHTKDRFLVNRRYQRKLVWTIEEKMCLSKMWKRRNIS